MKFNKKDYDMHKKAMGDNYFTIFKNILNEIQRGTCSSHTFSSAPIAELNSFEDLLNLDFDTSESRRYHSFTDDKKIQVPVFAHIKEPCLSVVAVLDNTTEDGCRVPFLRDRLIMNVFSSHMYWGYSQKVSFKSDKLEVKDYWGVFYNLDKGELEEKEIQLTRSKGRKPYKQNSEKMKSFVEGVKKYDAIITSPGFRNIESKLREGLWHLGKILAKSDGNSVEKALEVSFLMDGPLSKGTYGSRKFNS